MKGDITSIIQNETSLTWKQKLSCVWKLSVPSILAQVSFVFMEYIDAAMVGSLGAVATASIGLVAPTLWLLYGLCYTVAQGFSIQVAQFIGADNVEKSRDTFRQGIIGIFLFSLIIASIGYQIGPHLSEWLGASHELHDNSTAYFLVYVYALPIICFRMIAASMLQSSGNMKVPSICNGLMCILDVLFNFLCIFPSRYVHIMGVSIWMPGADLGVEGAALGTVAAECSMALFLMWYALNKSGKYLHQTMEQPNRLTGECISAAARITGPMAVEQFALTSAMVAMMLIVAPLGTVSIAANSFGIAAESICYMPAHGIAIAASTLVGQSVGANKPHFAKGFAWSAIGLCMTIMGLTGAVMYAAAPAIFEFLTPDLAVRELGVEVLRIELWAEPLFGAAIVGSGALRGVRDTFIPSIINLSTMWGVRMTIALYLVSDMGLKGAWIAMCIELCLRGSLFLLRVSRQKWQQKVDVSKK